MFKITDQGIDDFSLKKLNGDHIKGLFPKVGNQAEFQNELDIWKKDPIVSKSIAFLARKKIHNKMASIMTQLSKTFFP